MFRELPVDFAKRVIDKPVIENELLSERFTWKLQDTEGLI